MRNLKINFTITHEAWSASKQTKIVSKLIGVKYIEINTKWAGLGSTN